MGNSIKPQFKTNSLLNDDIGDKLLNSSWVEENSKDIKSATPKTDVDLDILNSCQQTSILYLFSKINEIIENEMKDINSKNVLKLLMNLKTSVCYFFNLDWKK